MRSVRAVRKRYGGPAVAGAVLLLLLFSAAAYGVPEARPVYVIPVSGEVDPGLAAFVERACREVADKEGLVVFEIDTYGGRVDSAFEIVDTILRIPGERTISFVEEKAISAGALIALASGDLAMAPGATLGDTAPIAMTGEGPEMMGEKFQSPIRAKFRAMAERNGYPVALAEAMVTPEKVVLRVTFTGGETRYMDAQAFEELTDAEKAAVASRKTVVEAGELLTLHAAEALEYGFSRMTVADIPAMLEQMGVNDYRIVRIVPNWSEALVRFIGGIAPILMMIGLAALYIEIKSPGFGLPGALGVLCLAIVFLNQYLVGLASYTEFLFIVAGLVLMGIEVFVLPGFGIAGFMGIVSIIVGLILTLQDFVIPDPNLPWETDLMIANAIWVIGSYLVALMIGLFFIRFVMPRLSGPSEGPYLLSSLAGSRAESEETLRAKVGDSGVAMTYLRPSGKAEINDEMFDVVTRNEFIEQGVAVEIVEIRGNWIVVARKEDG